MTDRTIAHIQNGLSVPPPDGEWELLRPGVEALWLHQDDNGGPAAAYLSYEPGAHVPWHFHPGVEHILVINGSQQDQNGRYPAGSVVINPAGSRHSVDSPEGCLVLAIWSRQVVFEKRNT